MKKVLLIFLLLNIPLSAQFVKLGDLKGIFMATSAGARIPMGTFANSHNLGPGVDISLSYTDNIILPIFIYSRLGYQHYPGKQSYYLETDLSSISTNLIKVDAGIRYFFPPVINQGIILMPIIEAGGSLGYSITQSQFKELTEKSNIDDSKWMLGFHAGGGFSMFLLDVTAEYNYFYEHQFLSFNLSIRIPIFATAN